MKQYKHKNPKPSKFDPYIEEITKYAVVGMTVKEICELIEPRMDDIADESALYGFMRAKGIRSNVAKRCNKNCNVPICDDCDKCIRVINTNGNDARVCLDLRVMIPKSCLTSPMECEKRVINK